MSGPNVELPADDGALESLLRERRFGPPHPGDATPWDFVLRWPHAVLRDRVWPIVNRLLTDADEIVRARAVDFVRNWDEGAALTMPRLLEVAEQHADLFSDQQEERVTLRYSLAFALSNRVRPPYGPRVAAVLREMATHEPIGGGAASVLGRYDPMFVAAQAQKWGNAQASWIEEAARSVALYRRDDVLLFLQAVKNLAPSSREAILDAVEKYIQRDDKNASFIARDEGLAPPIGPAPSPAECRSAIGL
jgi:hypothetical protein